MSLFAHDIHKISTEDGLSIMEAVCDAGIDELCVHLGRLAIVRTYKADLGQLKPGHRALAAFILGRGYRCVQRPATIIADES